MKRRKIRQLEVSEIGMGCMGFSHGYGQVPDEDYAIEAIRKAYHEGGCTFFDTAESYGREQFFAGHNEQLVGKAIEPFRDEVVLATKLHIHDEEIDGRSLEEIMRQHLRKSLDNLKTDHVDLYYLHRINENIPVEDVAKVMNTFYDEGLIKGLGLSQVDVDTLERAHRTFPVTAVQNLYSMVERDCEKDIFPYCLKHNIGVVPFSPIASGFLSGKVTVDTKFEGDDVRKFVPQLSKENIVANQPILDVLAKFSEEKKATNAQICLAWMLHKYPNVVPIPGSKNQERILENLDAANVELSDEEFKLLEEALDQCTVHGHRGHVESEHKTFSDNWRNAQNVKQS